MFAPTFTGASQCNQCCFWYSSEHNCCCTQVCVLYSQFFRPTDLLLPTALRGEIPPPWNHRTGALCAYILGSSAPRLCLIYRHWNESAELRAAGETRNYCSSAGAQVPRTQTMTAVPADSLLPAPFWPGTRAAALTEALLSTRPVFRISINRTRCKFLEAVSESKARSLILKLPLRLDVELLRI